MVKNTKEGEFWENFEFKLNPGGLRGNSNVKNEKSPKIALKIPKKKNAQDQRFSTN